MKIRGKRAEAEALGQTLLDLSIGEPKGPALLSARLAARDSVIVLIVAATSLSPFCGHKGWPALTAW